MSDAIDAADVRILIVVAIHRQADDDEAQDVAPRGRAARPRKGAASSASRDALRQFQVEHEQRDGDRHDRVAEGEQALGADRFWLVAEVIGRIAPLITPAWRAR